jgi:hypothetical protein
MTKPKPGQSKPGPRARKPRSVHKPQGDAPRPGEREDDARKLADRIALWQRKGEPQ